VEPKDGLTTGRLEAYLSRELPGPFGIQSERSHGGMGACPEKGYSRCCYACPNCSGCEKISRVLAKIDQQLGGGRNAKQAKSTAAMVS